MSVMHRKMLGQFIPEEEVLACKEKAAIMAERRAQRVH